MYRWLWLHLHFITIQENSDQNVSCLKQHQNLNNQLLNEHYLSVLTLNGPTFGCHLCRMNNGDQFDMILVLCWPSQIAKSE